jgi:hypothetical protein
MAYADYRLCDVCGGKAFYDANLNYRTGERQKNGTWEYPDDGFRVAGIVENYPTALDRLGDWAVICNECAKTHATTIVKIEQTKEGRSNG